MSEKKVLNLRVSRFYKYLELERRRIKEDRLRYTVDTAAAIGGALSKDGLKKYFKAIDEE